MYVTRKEKGGKTGKPEPPPPKKKSHIADVVGDCRLSGKKKAHKLLTHKAFETAVSLGTTSWLTRRKTLA